MAKRFAILLCALLSIAAITPAAAQDFGITAEKFRDALSERLKKDGRDPIASCGRGNSEIVCRFRGNPNAGAGGLLRRIDHSEHMTLELAGGKLVQITLNGQRNTPAAEKHFIGIVTSAIGALSPGSDAAKITAIVDSLGLTRDDNSPNIGESLSHSEPQWSIECLSQYSQVATDLACTIAPQGP